MRILMITDFYWPYLGGVEQHVRHLSRALAERGHTVSIATLGTGDLPEVETDGDVRVYRIRTGMQKLNGLFSSPGRPWAPPFPDPRAGKQLARIIAREKPQILHGHDWLARSALPLKDRFGAGFVMSLHYYTLTCAKKSLVYGADPCRGPGFLRCLDCAGSHYGVWKGIPVAFGNWGMAAVERSRVDFFLPVSEATAAGNGLSDGDSYRVIPNFLPDQAGEAPADEAGPAGLPAEPFLLFVGDLRRQKGLDVLLAAYAGLPDPPPLVLIGKIWEETPVDFPPNVTVLENWPNEAVLAAWRRCLIALAPSVWPEPFGIVILEAMASGRPVIASRIGGIPEIVLDGTTGLLVAPSDPTALREAIQYLLSNPEARERMGENGRRRSTEFRVASVVPQIEDVYRGVAHGTIGIGKLAAPGEHHHQQL